MSKAQTDKSFFIFEHRFLDLLLSRQHNNKNITNNEEKYKLNTFVQCIVEFCIGHCVMADESEHFF